MSLGAIIMGIVAFVALILGGSIGQRIGKSSGRKEGAQAAQQEQQVEQAKAVVEAFQERANVEIEVGRTDDADLDDRLSRHNRPD